MNELEKSIWKILGKGQIAALATITEDGNPWVRYVTIEADEDFTLRCCTSLGARKAKQILKNPEVHLTCGNLRPPDDSAFLQIAGRAEIRSDRKTREKYWKEEWRGYFKGPEDPDFVMVFIQPILIEYNAPRAMTAEIWKRES